MKELLNDPRFQGQGRHLLSALGPMLGLLLAILSLPNITLVGVLAAVVSNWASITAFVLALIPFYLSWKAKEKKEYKLMKEVNKNGNV